MYLDAAALGVPAVLGLLGAWYGFGRLLVSGPIRWLLAGLGALGAALLAALYLVINRELAALLYLSGPVATFAIGAAAFLMVLAPLSMFMSNLRERVMGWTAGRRIGPAGRVFGGLFGILCGVVLVAIPCLLYDSIRPERSDDPGWASESLVLPYLRGASEAVQGAVSSFLASASRWPRRQR